MTPAAERKRLQRSREKAGLVRLDKWVPAPLRDDIEAMADRMVAEWTERQKMTTPAP